MLRRCGHQAVASPTEGPSTAAGQARRAIASGADLILVAGGDGTINEVAQGVIGSPVPLGILPGGTANVLSTEMGLGRGLHRAAEAVGECVPRRISVGRLSMNEQPGDRYFLSMAGIGLDASIISRLNLKLKPRLGKLAYWIAGANTFCRFRLAQFRAELDGRLFHSSFVLVSRVRNYGGDFQIAPSVHLLDQDFEVVLFQGRNTLRYLPYLAGMVTGQLRAIPGATVTRARAVELGPLTGVPVHLQVDGELAGRLPARIEIVPDALSLLMPSRFIAKAANEGPRL